MKLLITLSSKNYLEEFAPLIDGVICGSYFADRHYYSLSDMKDIRKKCRSLDVEFYVLMDTMIKEEDEKLLYEYMGFLKDLDVDGIYFSDLAVIKVAKELKIKEKLIYESDTLMTNSLDVSFFLKKGLKSVVLARELTLDEIEKIADNNTGKVDVHLFGHQKMSSSKRKFLTNYFKFINKGFDAKNKLSLSIIEETRNFKMPILENEYGTKIYSDYVLCAYEESVELEDKINAGIIDDMFVDKSVLISVLNDYHILTKENAKLLENNLSLKYEKIDFDKGYFYQKTNITK